MRFPPSPLIPYKCKRDNEVVGPPSKCMWMNLDYMDLDCEDIEMMDDIAPVDSNVGGSNLLSGSVGSQNMVAQTAPASIDVLEPEQSTPDNQGVPETEVRQYFCGIACEYSVVTPRL